jgi:hypothetical protein
MSALLRGPVVKVVRLVVSSLVSVRTLWRRRLAGCPRHVAPKPLSQLPVVQAP